jgi:hypothetical protein
VAASSPPSADAPAPVGLDELVAAAALQDRVDVKYVVPVATVAALTAALAATHRVLEIDGRRAFRYETTYFDTPDLRCARDHRQGRRRRFKVRARRYADSGHAVLELKLKGPRGRTVKHGLALDGPPGPGVLDGPLLAFVAGRLEAAYGTGPGAPLAPVLAMTYDRTTLADLRAAERVTIDTSLELGAGRLAAGWALVETKSATGRSAADRVLRGLGARPAHGCSKYLLGCALARPDLPAGPCGPLLRRRFERGPAAPARAAAIAA